MFQKRMNIKCKILFPIAIIALWNWIVYSSLIKTICTRWLLMVKTRFYYIFFSLLQKFKSIAESGFFLFVCLFIYRDRVYAKWIRIYWMLTDMRTWEKKLNNNFFRQLQSALHNFNLDKIKNPKYITTLPHFLRLGDDRHFD